MDYKLKATNDEVEYITSAGSDFVKSKMPVGQAQGIIASGKSEPSDKFDGYGIKSGKYYFAGTITSNEPEKPADDPKDNGWKKHDKR